MFQLSEPDQQILLKVARSSILEYLSDRAPRLPQTTSSVLNEPHGVFVSIHKRHELRGCIGNIHPSLSLVRTVSECAITAAVGDPRFLPMTIDELIEVDIEVSILSPMERIDTIDAIEVGRDGLLIIKHSARGLLLPQVGAERGWSREKFLAETRRKAGLGPGDWKDGATIFRFTAHVFGETQKQSQAQT